MRNPSSLVTGIALAASLSLAACGKHENASTASGDVATPAATPTTAAAPAPVDTVPAKHHSKLGGALAGAAVGHMLGGHAVAGAAAGAIIQHERNKHQ